MKENELLIGRPHGGCGILWHSSLNCSVQQIGLDDPRICAVKMTMRNQVTILLINVYLPCDSRYRDSNYDITVECLNGIQRLINENVCDLYVVGGDFNAQLDRTTPHVHAVRNSMQNMELHNGLGHTLSDVKYTFESAGNGAKSLIDHFYVCDSLFRNIACHTILESVDNLSDHSGLVCGFNMEAIHHNIKCTWKFQKRSAWHKVKAENIAEYKHMLHSWLMEINIPREAIHCKDYHCTVHKGELDQFLMDIINACLAAERTCIPQTGSSRKKSIPGWNDHVKGKRAESLFWHHEWINAGRPDQGELAEKRRESRRQYHAAIRYCKKNDENIRMTKMADAMLHNSSRDFWREVRHIKKPHNAVPTAVDGADSPYEIANLFKRKFETLYSNRRYSHEEVESIKAQIKSSVSRIHCEDEHVVSVEILRKVIPKMKSGKRDDDIGLTSDCIIHGCNSLFVMLSVYFSSILCHGFTSDILSQGTMCPIPKSKLLHLSDKYRAITLSCCITKLFDLIFIENQKAFLHSDELQFGFKKNSSTVLCTTLLTEVAGKFLSEGSSVNCLLLDMSKAFDKVDYVKLFQLLINKGINPLYIRCLFHIYQNQTLNVKWNDIRTSYFKVTNGVRQGGVLSPILFCMYVDVLVQRLRESGYGCHVGPYFMGTFCYADDLVLLAPTRSGITNMLNICLSFAHEYNMEFNGEKSQYIVFRKSSANYQPQHIRVGLTCVEEQTSVLHLGFKLYNDLKVQDIDEYCSLFTNSTSFVPDLAIRHQLYNLDCLRCIAHLSMGLLCCLLNHCKGFM
jgi:hypothetical protein